MMSSNASAYSAVPQESAPLWAYVPIDQFSVPAEPTVEAVKKGIRGLLSRLRKESQQPVVDKEDLQAVPQELLDRIAPAPLWRERAQSLRTALEPWLRMSPSESALQVVIGAPHSGAPQVLQQLARTKRWQMLEEPTPEQITSDNDSWLAQVDEVGGKLVVIPRLERCYLRHHDGLKLIRRLFDRFYAADRRYLVGCDSWAWAYLTTVIRLELPGQPPLTLQGVDDQQLGRWLLELTEGGKDGFAFLQQDNGRPVLPPSPNSREEGSPNEPSSESVDQPLQTTGFLKHVAAQSRGNPGIAWVIWRASLQTGAQEGKLQTREGVSSKEEKIIWVRPWSEVAFPSLVEKGNRHALVTLHTLLLHGGLPLPLLQELLPFDAGETTQIVHRLRASRLVEAIDGEWIVSKLGYPIVRQILNSEGFLVDPL